MDYDQIIVQIIAVSSVGLSEERPIRKDVSFTTWKIIENSNLVDFAAHASTNAKLPYCKHQSPILIYTTNHAIIN